MDCMFLLDIVLTFFTAIETKNTLVTRRPAIARSYLSSWFLPDLIGSLPLSVVSPEGKWFRGLRLLRLSRLWKLFKLLRFVKAGRLLRVGGCSKSVRNKVSISPGVIRLNKFLFWFLMVSHWSACALFLTANLSNFSDDTWVVRVGIRDARRSDQYLHSVYWALVTLTSVGYGDITAQTTVEMVVVICVMVVGVTSYAFVTANLASIIENLDAAASKRNSRMDDVERFMIDHDLPIDLRAEVRDHYDHLLRAQSQSVDDVEIIEEMSLSLQMRTLRAIFTGPVVDSIRVLQDKEPELVVDVLKRCRPLELLPDAVLLSRGGKARSLYFVTAGRVDLILHPAPSARQQVAARHPIGRGSVAGLLSIFVEMKLPPCRTLECRAGPQGASLLSIRRDELLEVLSVYPKMEAVFVRAAMQRSQEVLSAAGQSGRRRKVRARSIMAPQAATPPADHAATPPADHDACWQGNGEADERGRTAQSSAAAMAQSALLPSGTPSDSGSESASSVASAGSELGLVDAAARGLPTLGDLDAAIAAQQAVLRQLRQWRRVLRRRGAQPEA